MTASSFTARATAVTASLLLFAACGSDKKDDASSVSGKSDTDCSEITPALVNDGLGTSVGEANKGGNDDNIICSFIDAKTNYPVTVTVQQNVSHKMFETGKETTELTGQKAVDLPDAGDEAYSFTFKASALSPELNTVVVRKGSVQVLVSAAAPIDKQRDLANKLLD